MNTTLIPTLDLQNVTSLAAWQANQALRAGRRGDEEGFAVHANKMYDILEASRHPRLVTQDVVRRLGRAKSMVLKIERPIINLALAD